MSITKAELLTENARLRIELAEALEQQTATSEILRVISSSPTDVQPMFDAVAQSAARLCEAFDVVVYRVDGNVLRPVAHHGSLAPGPIPVVPGTVGGRSVIDRRVVHVADLQAEADEFPEGAAISQQEGTRSFVSVPLLRDGFAIGTIGVRRFEILPFSEKQIALLQTFADQAVIAIENVRLFTELEARNRDLTQALEQQTATSEILRAISSSPTDLQPVLDTVVKGAARFCGAYDACIFRLDGDHLRLDAHHGPVAQPNGFLLPVVKGSVGGRTVLERRVIHVADLPAETTEFPEAAPNARRLGFRTILSVPLVRQGVAIGAIQLRRPESVPFTDKQVSLLQTFSDQAVIAIENVRLFTELQARNTDLTEALEQQTATAEILRVISSSPTDLQPVLDAIAENAARVCNARDAVLWRLDGDTLRIAAQYGTIPASGVEQHVSVHRGWVTGRAVVDRRTIHVDDLAAASETEFPRGRERQRRFGHRTTLATPLLREGVALGAILIRRMEVQPFTDKQIKLLETFADQAVIAVENVRLFKELEVRNRDLTEALDQQTATSEILRVISRSQTDVQPVFDTIVRSAVRLCNGLFGALYRFDGELLHHVAHHNYTPEALDASDRVPPARPTRARGSGRAILERAVVYIPDIELDPEYQQHELSRAIGFRSLLNVPMLREGAPIGVILVARAEPKPFSDSEIALLKTFADQAVIAIENVRLFTELETRNIELTDTLARQTATGEVLRAISRAQTDAQPVFDIIAESALRLCGAGYGQVALYDGALLHMTAFHNVNPEGVEALRRRFPAPADGGSAMGRALQTRAVVQIPDVREDPAFAFKTELQTMGFQSLLVVPMLRKDEPIGAIAVGRLERGAFPDKQIELLKTFADQAVIAIENVRLFKELAARTGELTRSVEKLTALGDVGRAVSSSLDLEQVLTTIVSRAVQLSGMDAGAIYEYDETAEVFHLRATEGLPDEFLESAPTLRKGEGVTGQLAVTRAPVQIPDISVPGAYKSRARDVLLSLELRAAFAVPLLHEGRVVGGLAVNRKVPGEFPHDIVDLLQTFATQSALAIQNARLFREIADKSAQLEAASRHKSEFLANMSHELRTPLNAVIGFSEVLAQGMFGDINQRQTEYLHDILESGRHLLSLINDILDLSKIEAGRMELEASEFDLPQAIQNALTLVRERALRRGIALHHVIDDRVADIRADERKVKQVLLNLLSNAIKFTPEDGRIEVRAAPADGTVEVSVTDSGVGIAPEDQEAVFEEFRQVGTADKKAEGTGLGLALSRKFIELHGGTIWVQSEVGRGSTFTFSLPITKTAGMDSGDARG